MQRVRYEWLVAFAILGLSACWGGAGHRPASTPQVRTVAAARWNGHKYLITETPVAPGGREFPWFHSVAVHIDGQVRYRKTFGGYWSKARIVRESSALTGELDMMGEDHDKLVLIRLDTAIPRCVYYRQLWRGGSHRTGGAFKLMWMGEDSYLSQMLTWNGAHYQCSAVTRVEIKP